MPHRSHVTWRLRQNLGGSSEGRVEPFDEATDDRNIVFRRRVEQRIDTFESWGQRLLDEYRLAEFEEG